MFKKLLLLSILISPLNQVFAYEKGDFYGYWGWNRSDYSKSDISLKGPGYDFKLEDVEAKDRQSPLSDLFTRYLNPMAFTIPQYNMRFGYFIKNDLSISFGVDHMKYVVKQDQTVKINGEINTGGPFDGTYNGSDQKLTGDFLKFEHTDGLNLITLEVEKYFKTNILKNTHLILGGGLGISYPKTNATILGENHRDDFKISGSTINVKMGVEMDIYENFFTRFMYKKGYVNMDDISTSSNGGTASQKFDYNQYYLVFGYRF